MLLWERTVGPEHYNTAKCLDNLAALLDRRDNYDEAEVLLRRALAIWENVVGPDHPDTLVNLHHLSRVLKHKGDVKGAEDLLRRIVASDERFFGVDHPLTSAARDELVASILQRGRIKDLVSADSLQGANSEADESLAESAKALLRVGQTLIKKGELDQAEWTLRRALHQCMEDPGYDGEKAACLQHLASIHYLKNDLGGAEQFFSARNRDFGKGIEP